MTSNNSLDEELETRIGKAATPFGRLRKRVWDNNRLPLPLKIKVYVACILSILLYGSEGWTTYRRQERRLNAFHLRCLRSNLGLTWQDCVPNTEILCKTECLDMRTIFRNVGCAGQAMSYGWTMPTYQSIFSSVSFQMPLAQ